jgi:uncharacterized membrane protein
MWQTRTGASAVAVELAAALFLAVAVSDSLGFAAASFYLLVAGVPLTAGAGLVCFARVVDAVNDGQLDPLGRAQATISALLVAAVVIGAAIREPSITADKVPQTATAILALGFALLVLQALFALLPIRRKSAQDVRADGTLLPLDG